MLNLQDFFGLIGGCFFLIALILLIANKFNLSIKSYNALTITGALVIWFKLNDLSIVEYIRGVFGDFSITTSFMLITYILSINTGKVIASNDSRTFLLKSCLVCGLFFYPLALGISFFDPYALGYSSVFFTLFLFAITLLYWKYKYYYIVISVVISVMLYQLGVLESRNIWDYLIDPWIVIFAIYVLYVKKILGFLKRILKWNT